MSNTAASEARPWEARSAARKPPWRHRSAHERVGREWQPRVPSPIDWDAVMFVPGTHLGITHHPTTVDNILYLLLERPLG